MADSPAEVVIDIRDVEKEYRGLRPLRLRRLELRQGQNVALVGFDAIAAELLVNLLTGAVVPDAGEVRVFGRSTTAITDGDAWLASLDGFGILSERAVLLDRLTAAQNLAVPFTLELDPIPDAVRPQVTHLAAEVGLDDRDLPRPVAELQPAARARVRLARAVALNPRVLLAEHPNAPVPAGDLPAFAADLSALVGRRRLTSLILTADRTFASAVAEQVLMLQPATGALTPASGWRRWFGS